MIQQQCPICGTDLLPGVLLCPNCNPASDVNVPTLPFSDKEHPYTCPKCGSDNTQSVPLAFRAGTRNVDFVSWEGTAGHFESSYSYGTAQSRLAATIAPPRADTSSASLVLFVMWAFIFAIVLSVYYLLHVEDSRESIVYQQPVMSAACFFGAWLILGVGPLFVLRDFNNPESGRREHEEWKKSFLCLRCGELFLPAQEEEQFFDEELNPLFPIEEYGAEEEGSATQANETQNGPATKKR